MTCNTFQKGLDWGNLKSWLKKYIHFCQILFPLAFRYNYKGMGISYVSLLHAASNRVLKDAI